MLIKTPFFAYTFSFIIFRKLYEINAEFVAEPGVFLQP